ncbi:MAG: DUF2214 family protein [Chitinophagales bacterium]|nr:DUF2214 family protein [Chitinophagales bacterium]
MTAEIIVKYIHFIAIFVIIATVSIEFVLLRGKIDHERIKLLSKVDMIYGMSAVVLLIAGLTLWFFIGKPAATYSKNYIFMIKITLFIIVGLLSIRPTIWIGRNKRKIMPGGKIDVPNSIQSFILVELIILALIPLTAVIMAKGIGIMI